MAALGLSSEFDYFAPQVIAGDILDEYTVAINPTQAVNGKQPIEFVIPSEPDVYRDLNNTLLEVTCKVTQAAGTNLADGTAIAPVNLLLHSMFKSVEVYLNNTRVSDSNNYYAERAYIETLLNTPEDVLKTRTVCEGWEKDDAANMNGITLAGAGTNSAFVKRNAWIAGSKTMKLVGRLHTDMFHQPLDLPDKVKITIKLDQNQDSKILMAAAASTHKVSILSARLLVRSKKLSPDLSLAHKSLLARRNYRIPYSKVSMKCESLSPGVTEVIRSSFHTGPMPSRVTIFMVKSANLNGAYNLNPFNYENLTATNVSLKVGSTKYPLEDITMDHANGVIYPGYLNTLASLGVDQGARSLAITPDDWSRAFNIYSFKLVPGSVNPNVKHPKHNTACNIELEIKFGTALTDATSILAFIETPALCEIDNLDNIIV